MIPYVFVTLDALPLTPNGKVDRKTLATQSLEGAQQNIEEAPPMTEVEHKLVETIQDILQIKVTNIHQNFFEMGLTSLSLVQVRKQLQDAFDKELTMVALFQHPTIAKLSTYIDDNEIHLLDMKNIINRAMSRMRSRRSRKDRKRIKNERI